MTRAHDSSAEMIPLRALPPRNFELLRRVLKATLAAAVVLPLLLFIVVANRALEDRKDEVQATLIRATRVAAEQANKVFDLDAALTDRVVELLGNRSEDQLKADQAQLHARLARMATNLPQVYAIAVVGADGTALVSSRVYPAMPVNIADRKDFQDIRAGVGGRLSDVMVARASPHVIFNDSVAWRDSSGRFAGMVLISLNPDYFQKFYAELAGDLPGQSIALTRSDGTLLSIFPSSPRVGMRFNPSLQFATAYQNSPLAGTLEARSGLDNKWKFFAYRRVEAHGGYVISAYPEHDLYMAWLRQIAGFSLIFLLPCAALWGVIMYSLRQLSREEEAWQRWLTEATARHAMEAAWRESRKMEALGKLMGSVSHDFNNLLMVVSANVQILRRRHLTEENRYVDAIERALQTGEALTRQLLTVSRRFPLRAEIVILPRQIELAEQLLRSALSEKVELRNALSDDIWPIKVDPSELQVALINIAVNARDAMPYGGVFTVWAENIVLPADGPGRSGEFVRLTLADNGPGMPESVRERVFEPLFTTKAEGQGTGLGLAQVFAFCEQSGGLVTVESKVNGGTSVNLYLPRAQPEAVKVSELRAQATRSSIPLRILLVEDNDDVAEGIAAMLDTDGHVVSRVASAAAALEALQRDALLDVVLSDIHMPGEINGIDLAEAIKVAWPHLPVLLMTGYAEELQRALKARINVLAKPFSEEKLNLALHEALARSANL
ncbi:response regulator [Amantichitinum ursilacus]|uniref:histidine kinase n=1 Tax=Amantichitinum ursilacus TaxID=857265 RepID=A0A0N0XGC6_9NEIS|nr:response regulator [Amantichitinum ursilacus]KPC49924.1 Blue-light-activated protein [Amantichitinum ursilacus]